MSQLSYPIDQAVGVAGLLADIGPKRVASLTNATRVKTRWTVLVSSAANEVLTLTLTDKDGNVTTVDYDEGATGTVTTKRDGLIAAVNASAAGKGNSNYVKASVKDSDELYIEALRAGETFTVAESEANLTVTNDVVYLAHPTVPFGVAVTLGAADNLCKLPASATELFWGMALFTHADNPNLGAFGVPSATPGYAGQSMVSVLRQGRAWAKVEQAVSAGDQAYYRITAKGTLTQLGAWRKDADGTAQVDTLTPTAVNSTRYFVELDGKSYFYDSDASATATEIVTGFKTAINADAASPAVATGTATLILTAAVAGVGFTTRADPNMSIALTTASAATAVAPAGCKYITSAAAGGLAQLKIEA